MTAIVRPDWKMPEHPKEPCPICEKVVNEPYIYWTGDGWLLGWDCEGNCGWVEEFMTEDVWPFTENFAKASDFKKLGFKEI